MISIDFNINSDIYWIRVSDLSSWGTIEERPSIIEVLLPGYSIPITKYFDKHKTNAFNSINLEVNCFSGDCGSVELLKLPDGIYKITVKGSPSKFNTERYYLKTDMFSLNLDKVIIESIDSNKYREIEEKLVEINMLIAGAESNLRFDRIKESGMLFDRARKQLDMLLTCKSCYSNVL